MQKVKFFTSGTAVGLEKLVNEFIKDKKVISVSYSAFQAGLAQWQQCCVLYEE